MAHGEPTPAYKVAEFRAKYIELGTVSAAARAVGLPESTAWDLAQRAESDPEFGEARRRIYARVINVVEDNLLDTMTDVHKRIREDDRTPEELAAIAVDHGLKSFSYQNPKPQYLKAAIDFYKAIVAKSRLDAEKAGDIPGDGPAVVIVELGEPKAEPEPVASGSSD